MTIAGISFFQCHTFSTKILLRKTYFNQPSIWNFICYFQHFRSTWNDTSWSERKHWVGDQKLHTLAMESPASWRGKCSQCHEVSILNLWYKIIIMIFLLHSYFLPVHNQILNLYSSNLYVWRSLKKLCKAAEYSLPISFLHFWIFFTSIQAKNSSNNGQWTTVIFE